MPTIWTIGYERLLPAELVAELEAELDGGPRTALMCLEADAAVCHRRVLTDRLSARRPGLTVVDL